MLAERAELVAELRLDDRMSGPLRKVTGRLGAFAKSVGRTRAAGVALGIGLERAVTSAARTATDALVGTVNAAIEWESAVAGVNKTMDVTPEELDKITEGLRDMSRKAPIAATDLAAIAETAGALGIAKENVLEFTRVVALIGTTTNVSTDEAATALGQLSNVLGLTADDYDNFAATLVDLGNKGASTEAQILEIARRAGAAANLVGLSAEQTLAWASAAANLGINAELAGTSLQRLFLQAMPEFRNASEQMTELMGMTAKDIRTLFEKDMGGAFQVLIRKIGELPKAMRQEAVAEIFGKGSGLTRLVLGLADSYEKNLAPSLDTASKAWEANTAALTEAEKRYATTQSQIQILRNNIQDAAVTIGSALLPALVDLAKEGTAWIQNNQPAIKEFAKSLAGGFRSAVGILKSLPWDAIGTSLQIAGTGARVVLDAFTSMPPWVQVAVASGWGLNKLTGGALGGLLGGALKGLGGSLFQRGGTPATPLFVADVTGGAGGVAGKAAGGLGMLAKGALAAEAAVLAFAVFKVWEGQSEGLNKQAANIATRTSAFAARASSEEIRNSLNGLLEQQRNLNGDIVKSIASTIFPQGRDALADSINQLRKELETRQSAENARQAPLLAGLNANPLQGNMLLQNPGAAGVISRLLAKGVAPTAQRVVDIMAANKRRTEEAAAAARDQTAETRRAAVAQAIAARANAILQSVTNAKLATIAAKDWAPKITVPVYVTSTVSVRDSVVSQQVRSRYTTIGRGEGPRGSGR